MKLLDKLIIALDERDRRRAEAYASWLKTPEGRRQWEEWQAEENRFGYR